MDIEFFFLNFISIIFRHIDNIMRLFYTFYYYLIQITLFNVPKSEGYSFTRSTCYNQKKQEPLVRKTEEVGNHIPNGGCWREVRGVKIINPYERQMEIKPISSMCFNCATCLAIAHKIENSIPSNFKGVNVIEPLNGKKFLLELLEDVCNRGFRK